MTAVSTDLASATPQRIVKTAVSCFFDYGYHATSMRQIAAKAKIQPASVYHWYPSKEALLVFVMERFIGDLTEAVQAAIAQHEDPRQQLEAAVHAHVVQHARYRQEALVSDTEIRALSKDQRQRIVKRRDHYQHVIRDVIDRGLACAEFTCDDAGVATNAILVQCTGVASWYRPRGRLSLEAIAQAHAKLVLNSLRPSNA
jgi:AcrR family transcriptional regulator